MSRDLPRRSILVALVLTLAVGAGWSHPRNGSASAGAAAACKAHVRHDVLPVWMRGGFTGPRPRVPYAVGSKGAIGGVVFGWPLRSPPQPGRGNKILWVPRHTAKTIMPFWIRLQLMDGAQPVGAPIRKIIATGPGPSLVDVPEPGCWRLTFSWSGRRDTLDLEYTPPA